VEIADGASTVRHEMDGARIAVEEGRVMLRGAEKELEIGRHLGADARAELAADLQRTLIQGRLR
jgi:uncharacterized membrane protein